KPKIQTVLFQFKEQSNNAESIDMYLLDATLDIIKFIIYGDKKSQNNKLSKNEYDFFAEWLVHEKSEFTNRMLQTIKTYKFIDNFSVEYNHMIHLQEKISKFTQPDELHGLIQGI
ncbi:TPA: hypothetical protein ACSP1Y_004678, partial [Aeromonas hydrophila]